ncbi:MAG: polysaccharide deacetylase family protein, partial [Chloroflexi bacterium]|nr:polysaccharide deacetylase family protein [Chloroflexota bacterium]
ILIDRWGRTFPRPIWSRYSQMAKEQGFDRLYLLLSFDCDTPEDAQAAAVLDEKLKRLGIRRSYAVPGTMLEANPDIYRAIFSRGAEFLNHGYLPHTQLQEGVYRSTTFYAKMDPQEVIKDVENGHRTVQSVIGKKPAGFRAPHFGRVPLALQRDVIRPVLKDLGEYFSTQTMPIESVKHGPVWWDHHWPEFPMTGQSRAPYSLLDSYSFLQSPAVRKVTSQYGAILRQTIQNLMDWNVRGLLNIYADPSHVENDTGFMEAMKMISDHGIPSLTYAQALEIDVPDTVTE